MGIEDCLGAALGAIVSGVAQPGMRRAAWRFRTISRLHKNAAIVHNRSGNR